MDWRGSECNMTDWRRVKQDNTQIGILLGIARWVGVLISARQREAGCSSPDIQQDSSFLGKYQYMDVFLIYLNLPMSFSQSQPIGSSSDYPNPAVELCVQPQPVSSLSSFSNPNDTLYH